MVEHQGSDNRFAESIPSNSPDFVVRRGTLLWPLLLIFIIAFIALLLTGTSIQQEGNWPFIITLMLVIGFLAAFTVIHTQRQRDLVTHAEFQNAMFAAAASTASRFSMILRRDGGVVYSDPGFRNLFPDLGRGETGSLELLARRGWLTREAHLALSNGLTQQRKEQIVTTITLRGDTQKCVLTLEPLPKPKGYYVLRGREYVERTGSTKAAASGQPSRENLLPSLLHLVNSLPMGAYIADVDGIILFANNGLEWMLGYEEGELSKLRPRLENIMMEDNNAAFSGGTNDMDGNVTLRRKDGSMLESYLTQRTTTDMAGNALGCIGCLQSDMSYDDSQRSYRW